MDTYVFRYRRIKGECNHCKKKGLLSFLKKNKGCEFDWQSYTVIGHGPERWTVTETTTTNGERAQVTRDGQNLSRMVLYFPNGSLKTIALWENCELELGTDWVLFTKNRMEKESGQDIKLNVDIDA